MGLPLTYSPFWAWPQPAFRLDIALYSLAQSRLQRLALAAGERNPVFHALAYPVPQTDRCQLFPWCRQPAMLVFRQLAISLSQLRRPGARLGERVLA